MRYPSGPWLWRLFPPSWDPHIASAVPVLITLNPCVTWAGRALALLDLDARRRKANHNVSRAGAESQSTRKYQSYHSLKNHNMLSSLPLFEL
jgi:hypothetical protein